MWVISCSHANLLPRDGRLTFELRQSRSERHYITLCLPERAYELAKLFGTAPTWLSFRLGLFKTLITSSLPTLQVVTVVVLAENATLKERPPALLNHSMSESATDKLGTRLSQQKKQMTAKHHAR